ncbi:dTDP-4-dehydrorhamnose reductase [Bacillus sp. ISL-47]|uniref:dTDP-4-dehydrorhamnose reductase n=1 Tax=Bacillus sp. ISL-47 TaxID=2819130 RepID=UPI001BE558BB|nr:dTDP-4-dehydrorhamnose reductase [Bacillus sp. ISL-47]MBT2710434.1 dTDP-4-dehydrorhamnose reductase [Pseudomonas sp. ISL-84]
MKVLITGAHGQLGKELQRQTSCLYNVTCLGKEELDITDKNKIDNIIAQVKPSKIIHAAAYTAVDNCELDQKKAIEVNGIGTAYIVQAANKVNARVFYISSDYVFDGRKKSPYFEADNPNPQSIYGLSKWLGERYVLDFNNGTVIRTSWLYGHDGKNFVKTMLNLAERNQNLKVVNDQIGSPTYVKDLAEKVIELFDKKSGVYHVSNSGECSWYEFAQAIFKEAGFNQENILPTTTEEFGALAPRPRYSVLGHNALIREHIEVPRIWTDALKEFIRKEIRK